MKHEEIIINLSGVIAKQNESLNEAQSSVEYLRGLNEENVQQINKLNKEIEAQNSLVAEQAVKIEKQAQIIFDLQEKLSNK